MQKDSAEPLAGSRKARAERIDSLIQSLSQTVGQGTEEEWRQAIELRLEQIDSGAVKLLPWRDAGQRLRDRQDR